MPLEKQEKEFVSENHNQEPETAIDLAWDVRCRMKHFYTVKPCGESSRGYTTYRAMAICTHASVLLVVYETQLEFTFNIIKLNNIRKVSSFFFFCCKVLKQTR